MADPLWEAVLSSIKSYLGIYFRILSFVLLSSSLSHALVYSLTDFTGTDSTSALSINNSGQIVGQRISGGETVGYIWTAGSFTDLAVNPGGLSTAVALNDSGLVVGTMQPLFGYQTGYFWDGSSYTQLGSGGAFQTADGAAINNLGQTGYNQFFLSTWTGYFNGSAMNPLSGGTSTLIQSANNSTPVGAAENSIAARPVRWDLAGNPTDLGSLDGLTSTEGYALSINNSGQIVGHSRDSNGFIRATLWSGGLPIDLGTLGGDNSQAFDINDSGDVVGFAQNAGGIGIGFLYSGGIMYDINTLLDSSAAGWSDLQLFSINNSGQIVGVGTYGGLSRAFLLNPVPEPSSIILILLGSACFGYQFYKKKLAFK